MSVVDLFSIGHPEAVPGAAVTGLNVSVQTAVVVQNAHGNIATRGGGIDSTVETTDPKGEQLIPNPGAAVESKIADLVKLVRGLNTHGRGVGG